MTLQCPNLQELTLAPSNWLNPEDIEVIFKNLTQLRRIHIQNIGQSQCNEIQTEYTIDNLKYLKCLKLFGPFNCIAMRDIVKLSHLEELVVTKEFVVSKKHTFYQ